MVGQPVKAHRTSDSRVVTVGATKLTIREPAGKGGAVGNGRGVRPREHSEADYPFQTYSAGTGEWDTRNLP